MATRADLAHLLRRATYGPTAEEVDAAEKAGFDATLAALLRPATADAGAARTPAPAIAPDPYLALGNQPTREARQKAQQQRRDQSRATVDWWLDRLVAADHQFAEKLVFFWHGHWATSVQKVNVAGLMLRQQETLRRYGTGDFAVFAKAMVRDPALIIWLDGQRNTRGAPNENLARELMELFTLGVGNYTEDDVKAGAKALTGWQVDRANSQAVFNPRRHEPGQFTILGAPTADADSFVDILVRQPAHAVFLASRLWFRFASGEPIPAATRDRLVGAYRAGRQVTALAQALFTDPAFAGTTGHLVKQPVEWAVGALRQLRIRPGALTDTERRQLLGGLDGLDQVPFRPPSVGGWPSGAAWLNTSSVQWRLRLAEFLAGKASSTVVDALGASPAAGRIDALGRLLVVDAWTDRTRTALREAAGDPRRMLTVGLASPEYTVS